MTQTTSFDDIFAPKRARPDSPMGLPLAQRMDIALMVNENQKVWIAHDKPFGDVMMWAEYDADAATLVLMSQSGRLYDLGMPIHKPFRKHLLKAREVHTVYMKNRQVVDVGILPLMVRETGIYHS